MQTPAKSQIPPPPPRKTTATSQSYPFQQGLDPDVVVRLLGCKHTPQRNDRRKYEQTPHFRELTERAIIMFKNCVLCGADNRAHLVLHHCRYSTLFAEVLGVDVVILCNRHHGAYHRQHKR